MTRPLVVVTRRLPGDAPERIAAVARVRWWEGDEAIPADVLYPWLADADGLLSMLTDPVDASLVAAAPRLRVISQMAVGVDNIDLDACGEAGIPVGHTPDVLTEATADHAVALLLAAARRLAEGIDHVAAGRWGPWRPDLLLGHDVHGTTIGIVGLGRIGTAVARRLRAFGTTLLYTGPGRKAAAEAETGAAFVTLDDLLERSDHVILTAPLTTETRHLVGAEQLDRMKPTATLVNVARGPLVDPDALVTALTDGAIASAALDVTEPEPIPPDHPLVDLPNCTIVPHVGSATVATREAMADLAVDNLLAGLRGEPLPAAAG